MARLISTYLKVLGVAREVPPRLSFLNGVSDPSSSSVSKVSFLMAWASFLSSSASWKHSLSLASLIRFLHRESLRLKVFSFPNIHRQYLHKLNPVFNQFMSFLRTWILILYKKHTSPESVPHWLFADCLENLSFHSHLISQWRLLLYLLHHLESRQQNEH